MADLNVNTIADLAGNEVPVAALGIGINQSWQEFTVGVDRLDDVQYTNNTDKTIFLSIGRERASSNVDLTVTVDGFTMGQRAYSTGPLTVNMVVPVLPGGTYEVTAGLGDLSYWFELRETP